MTRISVVVPCFNREQYVGETMQSVLRQSVTDWECIVIDDGSTDGSAQVVATYCADDHRIRQVLQANVGLSATRNRGLELMSSESQYILWLDSDDVLEPNCLERLAGYLDDHPEVGMVFSSKSFVDENSQPLESDWFPTRLRPTRFGITHVPPEVPRTEFATLFVQDALTTPSASLFRVDVVRDIGLHDTSLKSGEDWDFVFRVALVSEVHFICEELLRYRRHAGQLTAISTSTRHGYDALYEKWATTRGIESAHAGTLRAANRFRDGRAIPYQWFAWGRDLQRDHRFAAALHCYAVALRSLGRFAIRCASLHYRRM